MKTFEFQSRLGPQGTLEVPEDLVSQVGRDQALRVIVVVDADADWRRLTAEQFLAGYSDSDAIYDDI